METLKFSFGDFLHGADYNPEQWLDRPDILAKDIELMKEANCNVVSIGMFSWAMLEPVEGVYNFDWMANVIDRLYENGIYTILSTPSGARPNWLAQKYPEVLRVEKNRVRNLFGLRHNHCYTSPIYREKVAQINGELAKRFANHPGVILWHLSNEYGGECHCPLCQEAFRNWLKEKYKSLGFAKYAEQHRKLPITDKVKKGNATEILLTDYIQASQKKEFIKVYKLKYNPNVDQAIKGDDTLMVDLFEENGNEKIKIYLGESKFRTTPQKNVVEDITKSLNKDTLPLSYTFLVEEIAKSDELLARKLDDYIVQDIKDRGDLIYVGLLLSNTKTSETVEKHLNSDNSNLVFISIGIGQPEEFIKSIFEKAEELISNPDLL